MSGTRLELNTELIDNSVEAQKLGCTAPVEATESDIEFYRSKEFKPNRVNSIRDAQAAIQESEPVNDGRDDNADNENVIRQERGSAKEESKDDVEPGSDVEKKCKYWFTRTAPNVLRMHTRCVKVKSKEKS